MEQMMKELEQMMGNPEFEGMFGNMMETLMSRDLLYEPIKELASKVCYSVQYFSQRHGFVSN
jgi:peroxin-19